MGTDKVENNYEQIILDLLTRVKRLEGGEVRGGEVSESFESLGLMEAGEVRVHKDYLDPKEPGDGFSGIRIVGEGIEINGVMYAFVGYNADTATIGLSAETGEMFFCNFNAVINQDGITGTDLLKWMIRQTATVGSEERYGQLGMEELNDLPAWTLSFYDPSLKTELMTNGDFETGDFTGWTKTTETNCTWYVRSGYQAQAEKSNTSGGDLSVTAVLTSDRGVIDEDGYEFIAKVAGYKFISPGVVAAFGNVKIEIKWYDHASAGSLISTTTVFDGSCTALYSEKQHEGTAPSGTLSAVVVFTFTGTLPNGQESFFIIDDVSLSKLGGLHKLQLTDTDLLFNGDSVITDGTVYSGTYTPTLYNTTNVAASTAFECQYMRVGNVVTVSGKVNIDATTTSTSTELGMSVPINSTLTDAGQCGGSFSRATSVASGTILGDSSNANRVRFIIIVDTAANATYLFHFTYLIV